MNRTYNLIANKLGCEVAGLDLATENRPVVIRKLAEDLARYKLLVVKDQEGLRPERQAEITRWFGPVERTLANHSKSPRPEVFRLSSDPEEGTTKGGRGGGWQVAGSCLTRPSAFALYHAVNAQRQAAIQLAPLHEVLEKAPRWKLEEWSRAWMVSEVGARPVHPLVYRHPASRRRTLCFDLGLVSGLIFDLGTDSQRFATEEEVLRVKGDIEEELMREESGLQKHEWDEGDLILFDNLSIAHNPWPEQVKAEDPPQFILHRTTVKGIHAPIHESMEDGRSLFMTVEG